MRSKKSSKKLLRLPDDSIYIRCMMTLATVAANAKNDFDAGDKVDELVLEVCKRYVPDDKKYDLEEIITKLAVNMVYNFTEEIPF